MPDLKTAAEALLHEVDDLVGESLGVIGLHLNGDAAPWPELLVGGRFERLSSLEDLRAAIAATPEPVARVVALDNTPSVRLEWASVQAAHNARPGMLYAGPGAHAKPLDDEQVDAMWEQAEAQFEVHPKRHFARALEKAHGIGDTHG